MSHTKLFSLLENDLKLQSLVKNLASGYIEVPYIIEQTLKISLTSLIAPRLNIEVFKYTSDAS